MNRLAFVLLALSPALPAQQIYDLLLKNGRVIDPANHRDAQLDVAVSRNRIVRVAPNLPASHARVAVDLSGFAITPGLIDIYTHFDNGLKPDHNTLPYGVTTAVDAGINCDTFAEFKSRRAKTRLLAFISMTSADCVSRVASQNKAIVAGITTAPSMLKPAIDAAQGLPVMLNADSQLSELRPGDIATKIFSRKAPQSALVEARKRGILLDAPLAADGLWFRVAQPAIAQKFLPDIISSGMDANSVLLPRANLATSMSIFLNLGMTLDQIVERVTSNPARAIRQPALGNLSEGSPADIAVLEVQEGRFGFLDSGHARLDATRRIRCVLTVRNGVVVWDSEGLSIPDASKAGPYTNFK
jgi:dihydroorotase